MIKLKNIEKDFEIEFKTLNLTEAEKYIVKAMLRISYLDGKTDCYNEQIKRLQNKDIKND